VHIGDSAPVGIEGLAIGLVWTYTLRGKKLVEKREEEREKESEYKIFVEWLRPDTRLTLTIYVDDFLFSDRANRELRFRGPKEQTIRQLAETCNAYARALIAAEKDFYEAHGLSSLRDFYTALETTLNQLPEGAFLLCTGWGSGWEAKTIGDLLRRAMDEEKWRELRHRYDLGRDPQTGRMDLDAPFPKTRRIGYDGNAPMWPMGWVSLEPQEEG
jgi:CRISPR type III-A-associated RAMP protein Csm5